MSSLLTRYRTLAHKTRYCCCSQWGKHASYGCIKRQWRANCVWSLERTINQSQMCGEQNVDVQKWKLILLQLQLSANLKAKPQVENVGGLLHGCDWWGSAGSRGFVGERVGVVRGFACIYTSENICADIHAYPSISTASPEVWIISLCSGAPKSSSLVPGREYKHPLFPSAKCELFKVFSNVHFGF